MMEDQIISSRHQGSPSPHQQVSDEFIIPRDTRQIASQQGASFVTITPFIPLLFRINLHQPLRPRTQIEIRLCTPRMRSHS